MLRRKVGFVLGLAGIMLCSCDDKGSAEVSAGDSCVEDKDCIQGTCKDGQCVASGSEGSKQCDESNRCEDGFECIEGSCQKKPTECDPKTLDPDGDYDGDGIPNKAETVSDPCKADTDGDTLPDGIEDSNKNGVYEADLAESDPTDPNSRMDDDVVELIKNYCSNQDETAPEVIRCQYFDHAAIKGVSYFPEKGDEKSAVLRFETDKVAGFFAAAPDKTESIEALLKLIPEPLPADAGLHLEVTIPTESWIKQSFHSSIPGFEFERVNYSVKLSKGKTLQNVADSIAELFGKSGQYTGKIQCKPDADSHAVMQISRKAYASDGSDKNKKQIFSVVLGCEEDHSLETSNLIDDIISGTHIVPTKSLWANAAAYETSDINCVYNKGESFYDIQKVDFLWIVDNSSSMTDELKHLADTMDEFTKNLNNARVDFRVAVTTTDAYTLDEYPKLYSSADSAKYMNALGLRQEGKYKGFFKVENADDLAALKKLIINSNKCANGNTPGKDACGFSYPDGFRSGISVLSRLAYTNKDDKYYQSIISNWEDMDSIKKEVAGDDLESVSLRDSDVYVIWVTDKESRQFRENGTPDELYVKLPDGAGVCRTGHKLNGSSMSIEPVKNKDACNPAMYEKLQELIKSGQLNSEVDLDQIKVVYPEYADMLLYYINQYEQILQHRKMAGFALVGDIGREYGGFCKKLAVCKKGCIKDGKVVPDNPKDGIQGCEKCDPDGWESSPNATVGADYGLSYMHLARYLGAYHGGKMDGKEGGFASVCNDSFENSVNAIFEDNAGRVSTIFLKDYPIASTIRVGININGKTVDLMRGSESNGWNYDYVSNSIYFTGVKADPKDKFVIEYHVWKSM